MHLLGYPQNSAPRRISSAGLMCFASKSHQNKSLCQQLTCKAQGRVLGIFSTSFSMQLKTSQLRSRKEKSMSKRTIIQYPKSDQFKKWLKEVGSTDPAIPIKNTHAYALLKKNFGIFSTIKNTFLYGAVSLSALLGFGGGSLSAEPFEELPTEVDGPIQLISPAFLPDLGPLYSLPVSDWLSVLNSTLMLFQLGLVMVQVFILLKIRRNLRADRYGKDVPEDTVQRSPPSSVDKIVVELPLFIGGASLTGKVRSENQDNYHCQVFSESRSLISVFDGVGGKPGGCEAAHTAANVVSDWLAQVINDGKTIGSDLCAQALEVSHQAFKDKSIEGSTTAIVGLIDGDWLHYAALGDGSLRIIHVDGMVHDCFAPHHALNKPSNIITASMNRNTTHVPRQGSIRLEPGALVFAMTDGASDLLPFDQLAEQRDMYREKIEKIGVDRVANKILNDLEQARNEDGAYLHSDNMTCAIAVIA